MDDPYARGGEKNGMKPKPSRSISQELSSQLRPPSIRPSVIRPQPRPHILRSRRNPLLHAAQTIQRRPYVEREDGRAVGAVGRGVVVDHVAHFFAGGFAFDYPVVAVEGGFRAVGGGEI